MVPRFVVKINKLGILYFYLSNLALEGKKFWVRKKYNKKLLSIIGPLNRKERQEVNLLGQLIISLEKKKKPVHLLEIFFNEKNPWGKLASLAGKTKAKRIEKIFHVFYKKLDAFWKNELAIEAVLGKKHLEKNIRKEKQFINSTLKNLSILYSKKKSPQTVKIFLIPLPSEIKERGGKYIPSLCSVTLESSSERAKEKRALEIILHETVHLCFEGKKFFEILNKTEDKIPPQQRKKMTGALGISSIKFIIKEIVATSTTMKPRCGLPDSYSSFIVSISNKLKPLVKKYVKSKKSIDAFFVEKIIDLWIDFMRKKRL